MKNKRVVKSRREKDLEESAGAWTLTIAGILFVFMALGFESLWAGIIGIVFIGIGWLLLHSIQSDRERRKLRDQEMVKRRDARIEKTIKSLPYEIETHRHALRRNLERAVIINDYGAITEDNRNEVIKEFMKSVGLDWDLIGTTIAKEIIDEELAEWEERDREAGFDPDTLPADGLEFEHWVADGLITFGWDAQVTSASGDQGIDVIAEMDGKKVGLQCKLFSSPVGNKAVQEAHAGKTFHQADAVAVISNASYTPSAKSLAADTGVKLLSHHDIPNLYEKMFG